MRKGKEGEIPKHFIPSRTEEYLRERAQRGDVAKAKRILKRAGRGKPPVSGDEVN